MIILLFQITYAITCSFGFQPKSKEECLRKVQSCYKSTCHKNECAEMSKKCNDPNLPTEAELQRKEENTRRRRSNRRSVNPDEFRQSVEILGGWLRGYNQQRWKDYRGETDSFGSPNGYGLMKWENYTYEGNWKDGEPHGTGVMKWKNRTYEGDWKEGKPHGTGNMTWTNGMVYEGNWKHGKSHGHGTMSLPNGITYSGDWTYEQMSGEGIMTWPNGDFYKGSWKEGKFDAGYSYA